LVGNGVPVDVDSGVSVGKDVADGIGVAEGVLVGNRVSVLVDVAVGNGVSVGVGVTVGVYVTVGVLVGVRVGISPICSPVHRTELTTTPIKKIAPKPYSTTRKQPFRQPLSLPLLFVLRALLLINHLCSTTPAHRYS
jgi:hypothetical protein